MTISQLAGVLLAYRRERDVLQEQITRFLEQDPRVVAAWVFGSLGRGNADELSDLDLWVVVADKYAHDIINQRQQYAAQIGKLILFVEAPQNAPADGGYLMTHYDAPIAPHQVDWYWQPQSQAVIPGEARLLFDKVGLQRSDRPIVFPSREPVKEIIENPFHFISYFWVMLLITAKHAARSPWAEKMELLPYVLAPFRQTQHFLGLELVTDFPLHDTPPSQVPYPS